MIKNGLFVGTLFHKRFSPKVHEFTYPVFFFCVDLDELDNLDQSLFGFSYNRFNIVSLHNKDYIFREKRAIKEQVLECIEKKYNTKNITSIKCVTSLKFLGYTFNPVNFFYCYDQNKQLECILAEVNNTFSETHHYVLTDFVKKGQFYQTNHAKQFYVSPFFKVEGQYNFVFSDICEKMKIIINYNNDNKNLLNANLQGIYKPLTTLNLWKVLLTYPFLLSLPFIRICKEAFMLKCKKINVVKKPDPNHLDTKQNKSSGFLLQLFTKKVLAKFQSFKGDLFILQLPSGQRVKIGDTKPDTEKVVFINNLNFFKELAIKGSMGVGESYQKGHWKTDFLTDFLIFLLKNSDQFLQRKSLWFILFMKCNRVLESFRKNSIFQSQKNIQAHYDLGNNFFELFLDDSMMYSSAIYDQDNLNLADAQAKKINVIMDRLELDSSHHVLEIGSGWGSLAVAMSKTYKCKVTTITISENQYQYVKQRIKDEGLKDYITVLKKDYRLLEGKFDRIVSIEMIEAVGHQYLTEYFTKLDDLLSSSGKIFIQGIMIADSLYQRYLKERDWIQKHIFPGGHLPSLGHIEELVEKATNLSIEKSINIGHHYVKTLQDWRHTFYKNIEEVKKLGFDSAFIRKWAYYFSYCEAGFTEKVIHNYHLTLKK